jgi:hypothetical protein
MLNESGFLWGLSGGVKKKGAPKDAKGFTSYQRSKELLKVNVHQQRSQRMASGYSTITRTSSRSDSNAVARVLA